MAAPGSLPPALRELQLDARTTSFLRHAGELTELGRHDEAAGLERQARDAAARAGDPPDALLAWHAQVARRRSCSPAGRRPRGPRAALALALPATRRRATASTSSSASGSRCSGWSGPTRRSRSSSGRSRSRRARPRVRRAAGGHRALAASLRAAGRDADAAPLEAPLRAAPAEPPRRRRAAPAPPHARPAAPRPLPPVLAAPADDSVDAVFADLDALIGLASAKAQFKRLGELLRINQLRRGHGLKTAGVVLHMVFTGGPGTGKTTLARLVGRLYHALELLESGDVVEVTRADLVSGFVGQTAQRTNEVIDSALGNVLFIDEAYALVRPGADGDFGPEAVAELLKRMEDDRDRLAVIIAGYPAEIDAFLATNPGFASRFGETLTFEDFSPAELPEIFERAFCLPSDYRLSDARARGARAVTARLHADARRLVRQRAHDAQPVRRRDRAPGAAARRARRRGHARRADDAGAGGPQCGARSDVAFRGDRSGARRPADRVGASRRHVDQPPACAPGVTTVRLCSRMNCCT